MEKKKSIFLYMLLFAGMAIFYNCYHFYVSISSDTTTLIPMAYEVLNGNILLKGWVLGTNNFYFTDTIWQMICFALSMSARTAIYLIPSLTAAGITTLACYSVQRQHADFFAKQNANKNLLHAALMMLIISVIGIIGTQSSYTLLNLNSHNIVYLYYMIFLGIILRYLRKGNAKLLGLYLLLVALSTFSDGTTLEVILAPVCICSFAEILKKKEIKRNSLVIGSSVLAYVLSNALFFVVENAGGLITRGYPLQVSFVTEWGGG